jgi:hypothetical protein
MVMRDDGEPISRGQLDRHAADVRALRDSLFVAAFFGGVVLINGILAILLIEFFQSIGWWEVQPAGGAEGPPRYRDGLDVAAPRLSRCPLEPAS